MPRINQFFTSSIERDFASVALGLRRESKKNIDVLAFLEEGRNLRLDLWRSIPGKRQGTHLT
jgi:hypothetical protein